MSPQTPTGKRLVERAVWNDGMRGFFVRVLDTGSPDDMKEAVRTIEAEAVDLVRMECESEEDWSGLSEHPPTTTAECHFCAGDVALVKG